MNIFQKLFVKKPVKQDEKGFDFDIYLASRDEEVMARFPIGKRIVYLGVPMVISYKQHYQKGFQNSQFWSPTVWPKIICEYVGANGQIAQHEFNPHQIEALLGEAS